MTHMTMYVPLNNKMLCISINMTTQPNRNTLHFWSTLMKKKKTIRNLPCFWNKLIKSSAPFLFHHVIWVKHHKAGFLCQSQALYLHWVLSFLYSLNLLTLISQKCIYTPLVYVILVIPLEHAATRPSSLTLCLVGWQYSHLHFSIRVRMLTTESIVLGFQLWISPAHRAKARHCVGEYCGQKSGITLPHCTAMLPIRFSFLDYSRKS